MNKGLPIIFDDKIIAIPNITAEIHNGSMSLSADKEMIRKFKIIIAIVKSDLLPSEIYFLKEQSL